MAFSKGLIKFLDKDGKVVKNTRKNKYKLLRFYGYSLDQIQGIFQIETMTRYRQIKLGNMVLKDSPVRLSLFTKEERELFTDEEMARLKELHGELPDTSLAVEVPHVSESVSDSLKELVKPNEIKPIVTSSSVCEACWGKGWRTVKVDGKFRAVACAQCGGLAVRKKEIDTDRLDDYNLSSLIPNAYFQSSVFESGVIRGEVGDSEYRVMRAVDNYLEELDYLLAVVRGGELPSKSYYIAMPDGFGKKHFIYECMRECLSHQYLPTPLLDYYDLEKMLFDGGDKEELQNRLNRDILFLTVSNISRKKYLVTHLKYLLDYGERFGKPIVMIGRVLPHLIAEGHLDGTSLFAPKNKGDYGHFEVVSVPRVDFYHLMGGGSVSE